MVVTSAAFLANATGTLADPAPAIMVVTIRKCGRLNLSAKTPK
jgi:hypothetical protein